MFSDDRTADVYLLGSGIYSFMDMTLLTQHILSTKCKTVYFLHDLPSLEKYLIKLAPRAQNLMPIYYLEGRDRNDIYDDIVQHVLQTAPEDRPVALLLHGHPLVYSTISQNLILECEAFGLELEIVPGVCSIDRMMVDLKLDIGQQGVQILEASSAVRLQTTINPAIGCFLLQIGGFAGTATRSTVTKLETITEFKNYLRKFYPGDHKAQIIESAVELGFSSRVTEIEIDQLESAQEIFNYNASMYVGPVG